jgi:hypothetical protein
MRYTKNNLYNFVFTKKNRFHYYSENINLLPPEKEGKMKLS